MRRGPDPLLLGVAAVYAAAAVPLFFVHTVLPALLRQAGLAREWIGLIFLAYLPYAARFLWSPLIDGACGRVSGYRRWIFACLPLGLILPAALLRCDPVRDFALLLALCAFSNAALVTAMTAADGLLVAALGPQGRAHSAPLQGIGASLGGLLLGGALAMIEAPGWQQSLAIVVTISLICALPTLTLLRIGAAEHAACPASLLRGRIWRRFLARPEVRRLILISLLIHGSLGLLMGYLPLLQVDAGMSIAHIALIGMVLAHAVGLGASMATLPLLKRCGAGAGAAACGLGTALCGATLALALPRGVFGAGAVSLALIALGYAFFVVFRALVLPLCDSGNGASEAALLFSLDSIFSIIAAVLAAALAAAFGIALLFTLAAVLALMGTALMAAPQFSKTSSPPKGQA